MMTLVVDEWMSLDGVVQSPSGPDEDPSGGFAHGGWHLGYFDGAAQQWVLDGLTSAAAFLFGRRTYDTFASHWPGAGPEEQVVAQPLNSAPKYVVTRGGTLDWGPATAIGLDRIDEVKQAHDGELHLVGSAELARAVIDAGLADRLRLMIDPVLLGGGKTIFPTGAGLHPWQLAECLPTSTGALLATYDRR
jgi:dihydrofolate reductase